MDIDKLINKGALKSKVRIVPNTWKGHQSNWSQRFDFGNDNEETIASGLARVFGISNPNSDLFHMAIDGDGRERRRICTLHSSSLLAFLFFSGISKENILKINGIEYDKCFFEIQNKVFPDAKSTDKPSNVDVVLYSTKSNSLLFIESKFTEYLSHGKTFASDKYYDTIKSIINICNLNLHIEQGAKVKSFTDTRTGSKICLKGAKNNEYLEGFKQAVSHIIGIVTGEPNDHNPKEYRDILGKKPIMAFSSIIFDVKNINNAEKDKYDKFYNSTIGRLNNQGIFKSIFSNPQFKYHEVEVFENLLTYQGLIKDNPQYQLPSAFMGYYRIIE